MDLLTDEEMELGDVTTLIGVDAESEIGDQYMETPMVMPMPINKNLEDFIEEFTVDANSNANSSYFEDFEEEQFVVAMEVEAPCNYEDLFKS